jgi:hypothetical protein
MRTPRKKCVQMTKHFRLDPNKPPTLTDAQALRLDTMTDEDVTRAALADPDAQPLTEADLDRMKRVPRRQR